MAKVLFVDDEPDIEFLTKQKFRKQIESGIFDLLFASNGQKALDIIEKESPIAIVVSDVNMPEMDGLTLLDKLKDLSPETKTIVVSAYGDTKTLRSAMNKGAYDFVTKPVDFKDLEETILRTLALYKLPSSSLYTYQQLLALDFPKHVDLGASQGKDRVLWDAFTSQSGVLLLLGVSVLPSPIPLEIGIGIAHSYLKSALLENKNAPLDDWLKDISCKNKGLTSHLVIGHYHLESRAFSYRAKGDFKVHLISSEGKKGLIQADTAMLTFGDVVSLEYPLSPSHLSLTCLK